MISLVMQLLKTAAVVPAAVLEGLILTVLIWAVSSAIFSAIYLAEEETDVPAMHR